MIKRNAKGKVKQCNNLKQSRFLGTNYHSFIKFSLTLQSKN